MLTNLKEILQVKGIRIEDSVYGRVGEAILDFPMNIGDFFRPESDGPGTENFEILNRLHSLIEANRKSSEYETLSLQLQQTEARLKEIKGSKNHDFDPVTEKLELRENKKKLKKNRAALEDRYFEQAIETIRKEYDYGFVFLEYKNSFYCSDFTEIAAVVPQIKAVNAPKLKEMPLFVRDIRSLSLAIQKGDSIGIVGGPCLFGAYEVMIDIHHVDGHVAQFDFSTGRIYDKGVLAEPDLESYLSKQHESIVKLTLTNFKGGVTYQEYLSMHYLFEFAAVLGAKVVIPIPDMSYMKFFKGIVAQLPERVKGPAIEDFEEISQYISGLYLATIDRLKRQYPGVECRVLYSGDSELCEIFYNKRQPYIGKLSRQGRITEYLGRTDAVTDYISMLALPYYVYGTRHVLQIDSVDEADSMRKCMKIHYPDVTFHSILFPEYLSEDGVHTVYAAPLEFKQYIQAGG